MEGIFVCFSEMVDGGTPNIRTFIENYDRVKEKYGKDF